MTHPCLPDQNRPVTGNTVAKPTYLVLHAILRFCIRFPLYSMALYQGVGLGASSLPSPVPAPSRCGVGWGLRWVRAWWDSGLGWTGGCSSSSSTPPCPCTPPRTPPGPRAWPGSACRIAPPWSCTASQRPRRPTRSSPIGPRDVPPVAAPTRCRSRLGRTRD